MAPNPEVLKRSQYFTPPSTEHPHSSRTHYFDWQEYHRPLLRMHHAHLHDWGIASGLAVRVTDDGAGVEVQPGVAVDSVGELITLALEGQADISPTQPGEAGQQISAPFRLSTAGLAGQTRYLTIQFAERLRFGEGSGGKQEQTPWLRLELTNAYSHDGSSIILAIVVVDSAGGVVVHAYDNTLPYRRRLVSSVVEALHLRRATSITGHIQESTAARIAPIVDGGLQITVPEMSDRMLLSHMEGNNFSTLEVRADNLYALGDLQVQGVLHVQTDIQAQGDLRVNKALRVTGATTLLGNVSIGTAVTGAQLDINGPLKLQRGVAIHEFSNDNTLTGNRASAVPTEQAVKEYVDNLLTGSVTAFATVVPPSGWLECNGQAIHRVQYARLFARIGTTFGQGDGATTFNVPDLRGLFIRGWDHGSGRDSGRSFGTYQADGYQNHTHSFFGNFATIGGGWHDHVDHSGGFWSSIKLAGGGNAAIRRHDEGNKTWGEVHSHGYTPSGTISYATTGNMTNETRSKNQALMYCIKD